MEAEEPDFETSEMCLVSALKIEGEMPVRTYWEGDRKGTCYWVFKNTSRVREIVGSYFTETLRVEPRLFNQLFGDTKKEFYAHADRVKAS